MMCIVSMELLLGVYIVNSIINNKEVNVVQMIILNKRE